MMIQPAPELVVAGRFRLSRMIGRGGMGSVWLATHLGLDVPCAVKFIEGEGADLPEVQTRFEREAKAAAQLRSPHVVQILDHGVWEGTPYIAMELLDGEDLGKRLARVGRLPPHEVLTIITQVCRALARAHAVGIVHRDLKPDNIFLVRDDDREIAKVLDFGIAKSTGAGAPGASTRTGAMLGTPYYMSPEQAQGTRAVDARSDLWALAVIVFEALTGHRPFESEALGDLLMRIIVAPIPMPSQVARDLSPMVDSWWARASQRDPARRYQSAKELCDGLALAFGRSGSELAEGAPPFTGPTAGLAPLYGLTPQPNLDASTGAPIARTYDQRPDGVPRRAGLFVAVGAGVMVLAAAAIGVFLVVNTRGDAADHAAAAPAQPAAAADAMLIEHLAPPATPPEVASALALPAAAPPSAAAADVPAAPAIPAKTVRSAVPWVAPRPQPPSVARPDPPVSRPPEPKPEPKKKPVDLGI